MTMRIYKHCGPYWGRQPEVKPKEGGGQLLRQSSKQAANPERFEFEPAPRGHYDVEDNYLRGRAAPSANIAWDGKKGRR